MKLDPINLCIKAVADSIKNKYQSYLTDTNQYWTITRLNEDYELFVLTYHNYNAAIYNPFEVKNPVSLTWYCFLDAISRGRHVIANEIEHGDYLLKVPAADALYFSALNPQAIHDFFEYLSTKRFPKSNLATIKALLTKNKSTIIYLMYLLGEPSVFEVQYDQEAISLHKAVPHLKRWLESKKIFSYKPNTSNESLEPDMIIDSEAFRSVFDLNYSMLLDRLLLKRPNEIQDMLINLIGIPEVGLSIPSFVTNRVPAIFVVRETI